MKTKATVLVEPRKFELKEIDLPPLKPLQMLVKIKSCGLCHSELPPYLNEGFQFGGRPITYPIQLGHEPTGLVEEISARTFE